MVKVFRIEDGLIERETSSRRSALIVAMGYRRALPDATIRVETTEGSLIQSWADGVYLYPGGFSRPKPKQKERDEKTENLGNFPDRHRPV